MAGRPGLVAANLFAHTGAFSVSLARAGAGRVYTVDLSPVYLDGKCSRVRRSGSCYRDGQCVNDCHKIKFPFVYGTCQ